MKIDNPAQRLLNIILDGKGLQKPNEIRTRNAWVKILGIEGDEEYILLQRIGEVMALPNRIIKIMSENFESDHWRTNHWVGKFTKAFKSLNLNGTWYDFINIIDEQSMTELKMISLLIETKGHVNDLSVEQLEGFIIKVDELKKEIIDSEIPSNLKEHFVKYLNKIISALDSYKITGIEPIMEAVESTLGHAFVDEEYKDAIRTSGFGKKLIDLLSTVANAVTVAEGLPAIGTTIMALLPK